MAEVLQSLCYRYRPFWPIEEHPVEAQRPRPESRLMGEAVDDHVAKHPDKRRPQRDE